jgi:hypothetical protein
MPKLESYTLPLVIFVLYCAAAFAGICAFRFVMPLPSGEPIEILDCFAFFWNFSGGIITYIRLFPALAFSSLVIPFGLKEHSEGGYAGTTFVGKEGFSASFLKYLTWPVISAAAAAAVYGLLFFLVLPLTMDARIAIVNRSDLYAQARSRAQAKAADKDWLEAARFIDICEGIWPGSADAAKLKADITSALSPAQNPVRGAAASGAQGISGGGVVSGGGQGASGAVAGVVPGAEGVPVWLGIPGNPVNSADALGLAEEAFDREDFYDAHWLATLAQRLARPGAAEIAAAAALASRAWNKIAALEPNAHEKERFSLYRMKREGYEAMIAGDWVSAFFTFQDLAALTPEDPDVRQYLENCKSGVSNVAFFIDELDLALGSALTGPVFSLPGGDGGRLVLRFGSLAAQPDRAYAWEPEIIAAVDGAFRYRVSAAYAKLVPVYAAVETTEGGENPKRTGGRTALLLRALDRTNREQRFEPVWTTEEDGPAGAAPGPFAGASQIMLNIGYDDFLLLAKIKRGTAALNLRELFAAEQQFDNYGYAGKTFRAEILRRLGEAVIFLPMAILAIILGWRYRAQKKPRYVYVPMLGLLPLVFYGAALFYRNALGNLSVWLSLNMGLSAAMLFLCGGAAVCFILALIVLAAQHG